MERRGKCNIQRERANMRISDSVGVKYTITGITHFFLSIFKVIKMPLVSRHDDFLEYL
jgi:hypothetical protein